MSHVRCQARAMSAALGWNHEAKSHLEQEDVPKPVMSGAWHRTRLVGT